MLRECIECLFLKRFGVGKCSRSVDDVADYSTPFVHMVVCVSVVARGDAVMYTESLQNPFC